MLEHTFETFCVLTEKELKKGIPIMLRKVGYKPVIAKKYIYAEGNIPIALVAHMDIVKQEPPKKLYYDQKKRVMWAGGHILGADDRAGVAAIWEIIKDKTYKPHLIFTCEEETGAAGAIAVSNIDMPFYDLKYIIELDRQGKEDCVFYECDNPEFTDYVSDFGFVPDWGTFTDISVICPAWGVAGVNLSVGYQNEHTNYEMLDFNHLELTIDRVKHMLDKANEAPRFKFIQSAYPLYYRHYTYASSEEECSFCGKRGKHMEDILLSNRVIALACPECLARHKEIKRCNFCGEYFLAQDKNQTICSECQEDYMYVGGQW